MKRILKSKKILPVILLGVFVGILLGQKQTVSASTITYIYSEADLNRIREDLSENYKLMANITLSSDFVPIGTQDVPFTGKFDGNGFQVTYKNVKMKESLSGFFGWTKGAEIKELTTAGLIRGKDGVGGIVGYADFTVIHNCINNAVVTGENRVGGIVSWIANGTVVYNCQNNGAVKGTVRCAGGIAGDNYRDSVIMNCANLADVSGRELVGGIIGGSTGGTVTNCSNAGNVTGSSRCGAIAGDNANYAGSRSYNYFLKTAIINTEYSAVGENCGTYSEDGSLDQAVTVYNQSSYTDVWKALEAWRMVHKGDAFRDYLRWMVVDGKPELDFNLPVLKINYSKLKLHVGESANIVYSLKDSKGNDIDQTVRFISSKKNVASVSSKGKIKALKAGACKITCEAPGASKSFTVIVLPERVSNISAPKKTVNSITLKWKGQKGVSGYQVYMYDWDIEEYVKVRTVSGLTTKATVRKLKRGAAYHFKIRAYVKSDSKNYYGEYSNVYVVSL